MKLTMLSFGPITAITGSQWELADPVPNVAALQTLLHERFPQLAGLRYRVAINQELAAADDPVPEGATIALLPPFSGG